MDDDEEFDDDLLAQIDNIVAKYTTEKSEKGLSQHAAPATPPVGQGANLQQPPVPQQRLGPALPPPAAGARPQHMQGPYVGPQKGQRQPPPGPKQAAQPPRPSVPMGRAQQWSGGPPMNNRGYTNQQQRPGGSSYAPQQTWGLPQGQVTQAAAQATGGNARGSVGAEELSVLKQQLDEEKGTNSILRARLHTAEKEKFASEQKLNMKLQELSEHGGSSAEVQSLRTQLRAIQQQLQHQELEVRVQGKERDQRLQDALQKLRDLQQELEKTNALKDTLDMEVQEAHRERRARAADASTPLSQSQNGPEGRRRSLTLSGGKRRRSGERAVSEPASAAQQTLDTTHSPAKAAEKALPVVWRTSTRGSVSREQGLVHAVLAECGNDLFELLLSAEGAVGSEIAKAGETESQLKESIQGFLAGMVSPKALCSGVIGFLDGFLDAMPPPPPRQHTSLQVSPSSPPKRAVWRLGAVRSCSMAPLRAAARLLGCLLQWRSECVRMVIAPEPALAWEQPSLAARVRLVDSAGIETPWPEQAAAVDFDGGSEGTGVQWTGRPALEVLILLAGSLSDHPAAEAEDALVAVIQTIGLLIHLCPSEHIQDAFSCLFDGDASLRGVLTQGLNHRSSMRQQSQSGHRVACQSTAVCIELLRLLSGMAASRGELLRAWGLHGEDELTQAPADTLPDAPQEVESGGRAMIDAILDSLQLSSLNAELASLSVSLSDSKAGGQLVARERHALTSAQQLASTAGSSGDRSFPAETSGVSRAVLRVLAAFLVHRQYEALQAVLARGMCHHLVSLVDTASRGPAGLFGLLDGVDPPSWLLQGRGQAQSAAAASTSGENLRIAQEAMALLRAFLMDPQLGGPVMEDIFSSGTSVRLFINATSRLIEVAAAAQSAKPPDKALRSAKGPLLLPLAGWAVAVQRLPGGVSSEQLSFVPGGLSGGQLRASVQEAGRLAVSLKRRILSWQQSLSSGTGQ